MAYPATPKTWVAGDVLTAAQLNAELRDALLGAFPLGPPDGAWTAYTPTLTQSVTVTKTVTYAKYTRVGRLIMVTGSLAVTGAGTAGQDVVVGLPVATAAAVVSLDVGIATLFDTSAGAVFKGPALVQSTTTFRIRSGSTSSGVLGSNDFVAALASGDIISYSITYESAT